MSISVFQLGLQRALLFAFCLLCVGQQSCAIESERYKGSNTMLVPQTQWPDFVDDLAFRDLSEALQQGLRASNSGKGVVLGGHTYSAEHVRHSNHRFLEFISDTRKCLQRNKTSAGRAGCYNNFKNQLRKEFVIYRTIKRARLTAYYTPTIDVMAEKNDQYRYPIYGLPPAGPMRHASRKEIDFHYALAGQGLELYYARDRFDIYILHIEGGGRLRVHHEDGHIRYQYLSYAGDNGRSFHQLDNYMVSHYMLSTNDTSRFAQRMYLHRHPRQVEDVYASCPGYMFFNKSKEPPVGSDNIPLTPGRSLAADPAYYPVQGLIIYITLSAPETPGKGAALDTNPTVLHHRNIRRFFIDQDEGSHIKGPARFDLFFGESDNALFLANNLRTTGAVYFLILK